MVSEVAYADELLDMALITKIYEHYNMEEGKYFENIINIARNRQNVVYENLHRRQQKHEVNPFEVNARYVPSKKAIEINAGILYSLFFNANYPRYMQYSRIGSVIGHEISHGFDTTAVM
ncbi:hypothetical protein ACOMHN_064688 [Nucella lapillus]